MNQEILELISEYIESIEHNFPRTHDDEVKLDILHDLYADIRDMEVM